MHFTAPFRQEREETKSNFRSKVTYNVVILRQIAKTSPTGIRFLKKAEARW